MIKSSKILFVGSFKATAKDGSVGGQMFACKTIINSSISDSVDWTLIDTTSDSNVPTGFIKRSWKALLRVLKFIYRIIFFKYDVVLIFVADGWSFWEKGLMSLIAKFLSKAKVIIAPRSGYLADNITDNGRLSRFITKVFNKVDIVICQSMSWKNIFIKCAPLNDPAKFVVIENMLDYKNYGELSLQSKKAEDGEVITILFMAWVKRNKGIYEFIEAIRLLNNEKLSFKVIIAGKGEDSDIIVKEIEKAGLNDTVNVKGWVLGEEKLILLSESDIFVLPTYFEGYPNSLMEAMASGKACIATKVGSIPDMIDHMETGILIDKKNVHQLYEALKLLIIDDNLRNIISLNARKAVKERNSIEAGVEKFKNILIK